MRKPHTPLTIGHAALGAVAVLVPLAWLASGLLLGFDAGLSLALHGLLLLGNLALLWQVRRTHRREVADLHRHLARLRHQVVIAAEDVPGEPPGLPTVATRARPRRSLIHDN